MKKVLFATTVLLFGVIANAQNTPPTPPAPPAPSATPAAPAVKPTPPPIPPTAPAAPIGKADKNGVVERPQVMAEFQEGGMNAMMKFLASNIKYPESAKAAGIEGVVYLKFVVTTDGSIKDITAMRSVDAALDAEAIRVLTLTDKKWKPGMNDGKAVDSYMMLPVKFKLQ